MPNQTLKKIRSIADYQFGKNVGEKLFPERSKVYRSKKTGRIRHVYLDDTLLATLRPHEGLFSLTIAGIKLLKKSGQCLWVKVINEVAPFIAKGLNVFAKHVIDADEEIRPYEEVCVINEKTEILAVGKAILSGVEMKAFKRGVAVNVRWGAWQES